MSLGRSCVASAKLDAYLWSSLHELIAASKTSETWTIVSLQFLVGWMFGPLRILDMFLLQVLEHHIQKMTTAISTDLTSEQSIVHILLKGSSESFLLLGCTHAAIKKKIHQHPQTISTSLGCSRGHRPYRNGNSLLDRKSTRLNSSH